MYTYGDPDDLTVITLDAGGLLDLGDGQTLALRCIRAFCGVGATYSLFFQKRGGTEITTVLTAADANNTNRDFDGTGLIVLPAQTVKITSTVEGTIDLYFNRYQNP
jgi:hypothetical protein